MKTLIVLASVLAVGLCLNKKQLGGYSEQDITRQDLLDVLTNFETAGLLKPANSNGLTLVKIETQVVSGVNYKYTFQDDKMHTCTVVLYVQSWTNTMQVSHDECHMKITHKRQLGGGLLAGGYHQVADITDQQYMDLLQTFVTKGLLKQEVTNGYNIMNIETQVVSGMNYKYTLSNGNGHSCTLVLYVQLWTSTYEVSSDTCHLTVAHRRLAGGWSAVNDLNDAGMQACLPLMLNQVNAMSNSMYRLVESGVAAQSHVVQGMEYKIEFTAQVSTCMNSVDSAGLTSDDCPVNSANTMNGQQWSANCWYKAWEQPPATISNLHMPEKAVGVKNDSKIPNKTDQKIPNAIVKLKKTLNNKLLLTKNLNNQVLLGGDNHDYLPHLPGNMGDRMIKVGRKLLNDPIIDVTLDEEKKLLGQDKHDLIGHLNRILGKDGHDLVEHTKNLLGGGDDHDLVNHVKDVFGQDGHDFIKHGVDNLLGRDGHDIINHGVDKLLGKDGHDLLAHVSKNLIGGDDHDYASHGSKNLIGGDDHDYASHGSKNQIGGDGHDYAKHGSKNLIGGDDHDYTSHGSKNLIGGDGHDYASHGSKNLIGGDGHDYASHGSKNLIGGDGHDYASHGSKNLIGGDGHDYASHGVKNLIGGDDHDTCHIGMFKEFQAKFNKLYASPKEEKKRYGVFCDNMRVARKLQQTEQGTARYGATKFADLTKEEFGQYVGKPWNVSANYWMKKAKIPQWEAPKAFDWRDHGAVTPVKNQGSCGSCWAFSTTGNIEGQWAIQKKKLVSLSEQELVDCDKVDEGCNGGLPSNAYKEIERLGGLETETDYAYKGEDEKCEFAKKKVKVYINDSLAISSDEAEMASWLAANGPISIGINAFAMQFYMGGISHPWKLFCNPKSLDHGVLIVGYGVQGSEPYWIVKNSWGPDWGEKGYYLVYRGSGVCGLNTMCTSAVVN